MTSSKLARVLVAAGVAGLLASGAAACTADEPVPTPAAASTATTHAPTTVPTSTPTRAPVTTLDGTAFFALSNPGSTQLYSVRNGVVTNLKKIPRPAKDQCVDNTVIVSPDGQWLAWATSNGDESNVQGTLTLARVDGSNPRTLRDVYCSFTESNWTKDGKLAVSVDGHFISIDPRTGAIGTEPMALAESAWSANRAFQVRLGRDVSFTIETADGQVVHTVKDYKNDYGGFPFCGFRLKGVSDDGRYVTIGGCSTDPDRALGALYLYDVGAAQHVTLPLKSVADIRFVDAATVVAYGTLASSNTRALVLMSVTGKVISTLPNSAAGGRFLGYLPAAAPAS